MNKELSKRYINCLKDNLFCIFDNHFLYIMKTIKILLVDDNDFIRKSIKSLFLTITNLKVVGESSDGVEVLPFLKKNIVDVVFVDIIMRKMDGFETTRRIKNTFPNIKVIAFTCADHTLFVNKMKECGADGFVSKFDANKELVISELKRVGFNLY